MSSLDNLKTYHFYNKIWYIAAEVIKEFKLSTYYNTYYSKYLCNGRLLGPQKSYEFRLSGTYLEEFKAMYGSNNASLLKTSAVWLIDYESVCKIIYDQPTNDKNVATVESNKLSVELNLGLRSEYMQNPPVSSTITNSANSRLVESQFVKGPSLTDSKAHEISVNKEIKDLLISRQKDSSNSSSNSSSSSSSNYIPYRNKSSYSEEEISDAITLLSSKLTTNPYQQEKLLENGSIRIDLFNATRRNITAIELKNHTITLLEVKEKIEEKQYINSLLRAYPNLPITFIFSSPSGIDFDAFIYIQQTSKSISPHKIIYKPVSNLLLDMINKREKDLPSYYYEQMISKPIIKSLLQLE